MENDALRLELDKKTGHIRRLYDKRANREILSGSGGVPILIDEADADTWSHDIFTFGGGESFAEAAGVECVEAGPVRAMLRVSYRSHEWALTLDYSLTAGDGAVTITTRLDGRTKHKILKLSFPAAVDNPEAVYEIPYGTIHKAADGQEEPAQQWAAVCNHEGGLALLNDGKYSYCAHGGDLRVLLSRTPLYADHYGQKDRDEGLAYTDQGAQRVTFALYPFTGPHWKAAVTKKARELNAPATLITETYHEGPLPQHYGGIHIDGTVMMTALKQSEDGDGYVARLHEIEGLPGEASIRLPLLNAHWSAHFKPHEIKTFFIRADANASVNEVNLLELEP